MNGCVDPGDTLTYECTVMGGVATIWAGSASDCPLSGNEIVLLHNRFVHSEISVSCNNGSIVARGLYVDHENNNYTSQLNVTVTPGTVGKTIICKSDNGTHTKYLSSWTIPTVTGLSLA